MAEPGGLRWLAVGRYPEAQYRGLDQTVHGAWEAGGGGAPAGQPSVRLDKLGSHRGSLDTAIRFSILTREKKAILKVTCDSCVISSA